MILSDHVAVAVGVAAVDGAVDLEDHSTLREREGVVLVRTLDQSGSVIRRHMHELPAMLPVGDVADKIELFADRYERALECVVVVSRDDQRITDDRLAA